MKMNCFTYMNKYPRSTSQRNYGFDPLNAGVTGNERFNAKKCAAKHSEPRPLGFKTELDEEKLSSKLTGVYSEQCLKPSENTRRGKPPDIKYDKRSTYRASHGAPHEDYEDLRPLYNDSLRKTNGPLVGISRGILPGQILDEKGRNMLCEDSRRLSKFAEDKKEI